ncbi:iron-sulfur cluster assembly scaffold protein [Kineococcus gypseus]|uniref:iron-sulfur cluster assembly scaffold protein n=1 Tax=Kineococcus gypseus TaxID=1637102 RepID=UPI003D7D735B
MSAGLSEQERRLLLQEHAQHPVGRGLVGAPGAHEVEVVRTSPLCGDEVRLRLRLDGERVAALSWEHEGCSLSAAATSALAAAVLERPVRRRGAAELRGLLARYAARCAGGPEEVDGADEVDEPGSPGQPSDLAVVADLAAGSARRGCAVLGAQALGAALQEAFGPAAPPG